MRRAREVSRLERNPLIDDLHIPDDLRHNAVVEKWGGQQLFHGVKLDNSALGIILKALLQQLSRHHARLNDENRRSKLLLGDRDSGTPTVVILLFYGSLWMNGREDEYHSVKMQSNHSGVSSTVRMDISVVRKPKEAFVNPSDVEASFCWSPSAFHTVVISLLVQGRKPSARPRRRRRRAMPSRVFFSSPFFLLLVGRPLLPLLACRESDGWRTVWPLHGTLKDMWCPCPPLVCLFSTIIRDIWFADLCNLLSEKENGLRFHWCDSIKQLIGTCTCH